jgi:Rnl2 family RNA ligase
MATQLNYPSIVLLRYRPEILAVKEVIAVEKIHGSCFRIGFPLGMTSIDDIWFGSREVIYEPENKEVKFPLPHAITWFKSRPELLQKMWDVIKSYGYSEVTVFGEIHGPGIQVKGVKYAKDGDQNTLFRAFDIMVGLNFLTHDLFAEVATAMGLPQAPVVWRGEPSIEAFNALLDKPSVVAQDNGVDDPKNKAEGVVIRSNPLLRNVFGEWLIIKHKAEKFSEVAHGPTEKKERVESPADAYAQMYVTAGRITNAIGRLTDRGVTLSNTMKDVPVLIAEVLSDLHKECQADWPAGIDDKQMMGSVSRVLGPIFRGLLNQ